jgi:hypothetical protein
MTVEELTLKAIEDIKDELKDFRKDISELKVAVSVLKTKAAIWGSLAGSVPVVIGYIIKVIVG